MNRLAASVVFALAILASATVQGAEGAVTYLHAGRVLDRPGNAPRGATTIVIRDGRIAELRDGHAAPPSGAALIDLKDKYLLPGLIDVHVHLAGNVGPNQGVAHAAYEGASNAWKTLQAGFTTVRNIGDHSGTTLALRDAIRRGWVRGPRILDAGRPIVPTYGHGDPRISVTGVAVSDEFSVAIDSEGVCDGADECRRAARRQLGRGADVLKIVTTGLSSRPVGPDRGGQMTAEEIRAIVAVAHMQGRKVAAHAHGGVGLTTALEAGIDSIEHGTLMSDSDIAIFRKSGAYFVPTLATVTNYHDRLANPGITAAERAAVEARIALTGKSVEKAAKAGLRIAVGTDAGFSRHGDNALEFELLTRHGLTPMQAIAAGTVNAADLLGIASEAGSIEPGKSADIIAVTGDPLADIRLLRAVHFVMQQGVVHKGP